MRSVTCILLISTCLSVTPSAGIAQAEGLSKKIDTKNFDPATLLWYQAPADQWENALPVGNGRLGAMVYGGVEEERIQLNEDTYWSGGPYSAVVEGGSKYLPEIQKLLFDGEPIKKVLEQRGDGSTGWSRAWKIALWSRLYDGERAFSIYKGHLKEQCYISLFAKCGTPLQVDGSFGLTAAITEMIVQSHEGVIDLLPAVPAEWSTGQFDGVRVRGGFELSMVWKDKKITTVEVLSLAGKPCRINAGDGYKVSKGGKDVSAKTHRDGSLEFETIEGGTYLLTK